MAMDDVYALIPMRDPAELDDEDDDSDDEEDGFALPYCGSLNEEGMALSSSLDGNWAV